MKSLYIFAVAVLLAASGCGPQTQPQAAKTPSHAQEAAQAPAGSSDANAAGTAPAQEAAKSAETAPEAAKPTDPAVKSEQQPEPTASGQVRPAPGKLDAQPQAGPPNNRAEPAPAAPAAQPPVRGGQSASQQPAAGRQPASQPSDPGQPGGTAAAHQPTQQPPVSAQTPEKTALQISITGDSKRGVILKEISVPFQEGMTVMDALRQVTKENKIQMEFQGKGTFAYVQGIDNVYEFDGGPKSGWVYKVNGVAPSQGAGSYKLSAGDKLEWLYTLNLGEDVGAIKK